jgi:hypothetical protein
MRPKRLPAQGLRPETASSERAVLFDAHPIVPDPGEVSSEMCLPAGREHRAMASVMDDGVYPPEGWNRPGREGWRNRSSGSNCMVIAQLFALARAGR